MKLKLLFVILPLCMMLLSCDVEDLLFDDEEPEVEVPDDSVEPEGFPAELPGYMLPTTEFATNELPDAPYAKDAIRIVADKAADAPFYSLELMPDGYYLLCLSCPDASYAPAVSVRTEADGSFSVFKHSNSKASRTKKIMEENETMYLENGMQYGKFSPEGDGRYRLSNGIEVDLQNVTGSNATITYKGSDGVLFNVYVNVSESKSDNAMRSVCHAWEINSFEGWGLMNDTPVAIGKQILKHGVVKSSFSAINGGNFSTSYGNVIIEREDYLDEDEAFCYMTVFTHYGTYICFYLDGEVEVSNWTWEDKSKGTLRFIDYDDGYVESAYSTVRFKGNQMRIYSDAHTNVTIYDEESDEEKVTNIILRRVGVYTLTALD